MSRTKGAMRAEKREVLKLVRDLGPEAVDKLKYLLRHGSTESIQFAAAEALLREDMAGHSRQLASIRLRSAGLSRGPPIRFMIRCSSMPSRLTMRQKMAQMRHSGNALRRIPWGKPGKYLASMNNKLTYRLMKQQYMTLQITPEMRAAILQLSIERRVSRSHIIREAVYAHYGVPNGIHGHQAFLAPSGRPYNRSCLWKVGECWRGFSSCRLPEDCTTDYRPYSD